MQVLLDASKETQVLATTHSPDILDSKEITDAEIRVVTMKNGSTVIAPVAEWGRAAMRERLYTPGELLRTGELTPDRQTAEKEADEASLFGPGSVQNEKPS